MTGLAARPGWWSAMLYWNPGGEWLLAVSVFPSAPRCPIQSMADVDKSRGKAAAALDLSQTNLWYIYTRRIQGGDETWQDPKNCVF